MNTKEFFSRWKGGIERITPMQMTRINMMGVILVAIGILIGIYSTYLTRTWWLLVVLIGSFIMVLMNVATILQKYFLLNAIEKLKGGQNEQVGTI